MPLDPISLAQAMTAADIKAAGGVLSPAAIASITLKNTEIATAIQVFVLGGDVAVQTTNAQGQYTLGTSPGGPTSGATTSPGTGTGTGKVT